MLIFAETRGSMLHIDVANDRVESNQINERKECYMRMKQTTAQRKVRFIEIHASRIPSPWKRKKKNRYNTVRPKR